MATNHESAVGRVVPGIGTPTRLVTRFLTNGSSDPATTYGIGTVTHLATGVWQVAMGRRARRVTEVTATLGCSTSASTGSCTAKLINVNSTSDLIVEVRHNGGSGLADIDAHGDNWIAVAVQTDDSKG